MTDPSAAPGSLLGKGLIFRFLFLRTHSPQLAHLLPEGSLQSALCILEMPALPASTSSLSLLLGSSDVTASPWQRFMVPPPPNAVTVNERSGSWQLPSLRDRICEPELLMMERKRVYVGKEAGGPWMAVQRCHGDTWLGRHPLDEAAASSRGRASAPL